MARIDARRRPKAARRPDVQEAAVLPVRLQKWLAEAGLGSRRDIDRWIEAGRVRVDGVPARPGLRVRGDESIEVDGRRVKQQPPVAPRVLLLNKAEGVVCTRRDPERRPTCFLGLPRLAAGRWINVGRLDIGTSGLLLLTNDGALAHRLMHPSLGVDREYAVRLDTRLDAETERTLREGVLLDDGIARFTDIVHRAGTGTNHWYQVVLMEGRNREVRRLFESQGVRVSRLKRVRFGPVLLPASVKRGQRMELSRDDVEALYRLVGLDVPPGSTQRRNEKPRRDGAIGRKPKSVLIPYPELTRLTR